MPAACTLAPPSVPADAGSPALVSDTTDVAEVGSAHAPAPVTEFTIDSQVEHAPVVPITVT